MSEDKNGSKGVRTFIHWVAATENEEVLQEIDDKSYVEVVDIATTKGYQFTAEEFRHTLREMAKEQNLPEWIIIRIAGLAAYSRWPD